MKLEIVNFKQAKALKELGFPQLEECAWYSTYLGQISIINYDMKYPEICAPTLELAAKWLREEENLFVHVDYTYDVELSYKSEVCEIYGMTCHVGWYKTYEEALSKCIDKAIKILKEK